MKILFSLNIHTEERDNPQNLKFLTIGVVPLIHDKFGVKPTFFIQVEPEQYGEVNLFRQYPDIVKALSKYGEIGLHSHFMHNRSYEHQKLHIGNALS